MAGIFTIAFAGDFVFDFGWGFTREDALGGLGMVAFGFAFWFVWKAFHGFLGEITTTLVSGAESDEETTREDSRQE